MRNSTTYKQANSRFFRRTSSQILPKKRQTLVKGFLKTVTKGWGSNLQNIEKSMREIYIPDEGFIFGQNDQSGAEALIVAHLARNGNYRSLFTNGIKPHTYICVHLFKDIWPNKLREHGYIIGDMTIDMDEIIRTPISQLKQNVLWKSLDACIKDSDNWALTERYYYLGKQTEHCMDDESFLLTKCGWIKPSMYNGTEPIAIYDKGYIRFEEPLKWNLFDYEGDMFLLEGDEVNQLITPNHKVLYESNGKHHIDRAVNVWKNKRLNIPTSGIYCEGTESLPDWKLKLLVAIQADGHWCESEAHNSTVMLPKVIFRLKRKRKITRLLEILHSGNCRYNLASHAHGVTCITVFDLEETIKYFNGIKIWNAWLLNFTRANLELFVEELHHWDGTKEEKNLHKREAYFTAISTNAHWVKTICHLINKQGTKNYNLQSQVYCVGINNRKNSIADCNKRIKDFKGKVYCPTVSSGLFIINRKGKFSITGNSSNYDIQPPTFRMNILEKSGGKIYISREESERFIRTKHSLYPEIKEDFHAYVRKMAKSTKYLYDLHGFPHTITSDEIKESDWKEWYALIPQATVASITKKAYIAFQEFTEKENLRWDLLADTHDSMMWQCPISEVTECAKKSKECMEQALVSPFDGTEFKMKSETSVGFNWRPFHKDKNPIGLKEIKI